MLEVVSVSASYGLHIALHQVDLEVRARETVVMLGTNGAGKSTLLNVLAGLMPARPGSKILLDGQLLQKLPPHKILEAGIALVPEGRGVFGELSVRENLELGAYCPRARKAEKQNLDLVFDLFPKLKERMGQIVRTMSGGEQQMVAIGRALMSAPRLLLLDEPSLGLSPLMTNELFKALARIRELDISVLMVEQNAKKSLAMASRGYLIENGLIVGEGEAADLRDDPSVQRAYLGIH